MYLQLQKLLLDLELKIWRTCALFQLVGLEKGEKADG